MTLAQTTTSDRSSNMLLEKSSVANIDDYSIKPRLSVIIPACNEEERIEQVLAQLTKSRVWEVIVADGHSEDRTVEISKAFGAKIVLSPRSRGEQLNHGAAAATGNVLLFLHADTIVPAAFERYIFQLLQQPRVVAGAFSLQIESPKKSLRLIEKLVGWRSRVLQLPYGDQAIFLRSTTFWRVGGFLNIPVMEDFEFVRRLRRIGEIQIADVPVITSSRRWDDRGTWRMTLLNQCCLGAYLIGVSPSRIGCWRTELHK